MRSDKTSLGFFLSSVCRDRFKIFCNKNQAQSHPSCLARSGPKNGSCNCFFLTLQPCGSLLIHANPPDGKKEALALGA